MNLFTLNRNFFRQDVIDEFESVIWTERYYGNSEIELIIPGKAELLKKLPIGVFIGIDQSDEIMMLETVTIEEGNLKYSGSSLLTWYNNRFVRATPSHKDNVWIIPPTVSGHPPMYPGYVLWYILSDMTLPVSGYLTGAIPTGIPDPQRLGIPGLNIRGWDNSGEPTTWAVKFGPIYDALREIAIPHEIGMTLTLDFIAEGSYELGFRSYKGLDRTSGQTVNPVVRFSTQIDSFSDLKEIHSIAALKTLVYAFAPQLDEALTAGINSQASLSGSQYTGFDLRAQLLLSDLTADDLIDTDSVQAVLNNEALLTLLSNPHIRVIDGEIAPNNLYTYRVDYNLGDLVEMQGTTGIISTARITEYIRVQDESGERSYPTVTLLE